MSASKTGYQGDGRMPPLPEERPKGKVLVLTFVVKTEDGLTQTVVDKTPRSPPTESQLKGKPSSDYDRLARSVASLFGNEYPNMQVAFGAILSSFFAAGRLRHGVALVVAAELVLHFRRKQLPDPMLKRVLEALQVCKQAQESSLLYLFDQQNEKRNYIAHARYKDYLETRALGGLKNAGYFVEGIDHESRRNGCNQGHPMLVTDGEWSTIRLWLHYLWFMID